MAKNHERRARTGRIGLVTVTLTAGMLLAVASAAPGCFSAIRRCEFASRGSKQKGRNETNFGSG